MEHQHLRPRGMVFVYSTDVGMEVALGAGEEGAYRPESDSRVSHTSFIVLDASGGRPVEGQVMVQGLSKEVK